MFRFIFPFLFPILWRITALETYVQCIYIAYAKVKTGDGNWPMGKKSGKKDSQLILRLDKDERDAFVDLCKRMDSSASREIRGFIRKFMKDHDKG